MTHETEIMNKLFLELSQFVSAKTKEELEAISYVRRLSRKILTTEPNCKLANEALQWLRGEQ